MLCVSKKTELLIMGDWQHAEKVYQTYIEGGFLLFPPKKFLCTRITKVKELFPPKNV